MPHSVTHKPSHSMNRKVFIRVASCVSPTVAWQCRTTVKLSLEGAWVPHGPSRCVSGPEARRAVLPLWQHKSKCQWKDSRVTKTTMRVGKRWMEDNRQHHHGDCCRLIVVFVVFALRLFGDETQEQRKKLFLVLKSRIILLEVKLLLINSANFCKEFSRFLRRILKWIIFKKRKFAEASELCSSCRTCLWRHHVENSNDCDWLLVLKWLPNHESKMTF